MKKKIEAVKSYESSDDVLPYILSQKKIKF